MIRYYDTIAFYYRGSEFLSLTSGFPGDLTEFDFAKMRAGLIPFPPRVQFKWQGNQRFEFMKTSASVLVWVVTDVAKISLQEFSPNQLDFVECYVDFGETIERCWFMIVKTHFTRMCLHRAGADDGGTWESTQLEEEFLLASDADFLLVPSNPSHPDYLAMVLTSERFRRFYKKMKWRSLDFTPYLQTSTD